MASLERSFPELFVDERIARRWNFPLCRESQLWKSSKGACYPACYNIYIGVCVVPFSNTGYSVGRTFVSHNNFEPAQNQTFLRVVAYSCAYVEGTALKCTKGCLTNSTLDHSPHVVPAVLLWLFLPPPDDFWWRGQVIRLFRGITQVIRLFRGITVTPLEQHGGKGDTITTVSYCELVPW